MIDKKMLKEIIEEYSPDSPEHDFPHEEDPEAWAEKYWELIEKLKELL